MRLRLAFHASAGKWSAQGSEVAGAVGYQTLPTRLIFCGFLGLLVSIPSIATLQQPGEEGAVMQPPTSLYSTELNWEMDKKTGRAETQGFWKEGRWGAQEAAARASESRQKARAREKMQVHLLTPSHPFALTGKQLWVPSACTA